MKYKNLKKYLLFVILFITIMVLTFQTIFSHNNIEEIIANLSKINFIYIILGLFLTFLYFVFQGVYMKRNLRLLDENISLAKGTFYAIVEFFFSGITPSSTGGQPVQLYFMNKDKIEKKKALITLIINTIYFKLIILIVGIFLIFFKLNKLISISKVFTFFFFSGMIFDIFIILEGYLLLFKPKIIKKILEIIEYWIKKFVKNYRMNIDENLEMYNNYVDILMKHKLELFWEFIITILQRLCLFSISYIVYKAFGLNEYNFFQLVLIQIIVQISLEFVPLPGGSGVSEYLFNSFFIIVFNSFLATTAMLLTRTLIFYIPIIISGLVVLFKCLFNFIHSPNKK